MTIDRGHDAPILVDMRRKRQSSARDPLRHALEALERGGEPVILRDGRRPVGVLITVEDYRRRFEGETPPSITTAKKDGPTWPQMERRRGERRRGDRRKGDAGRQTPREGDPSATLDVLRELRSLGITTDGS